MTIATTWGSHGIEITVSDVTVLFSREHTIGQLRDALALFPLGLRVMVAEELLDLATSIEPPLGATSVDAEQLRDFATRLREAFEY